MKSKSIILLCLLIMYCFVSCEKLDFVRVMDTSTDSVEIQGTTVVVHGTVLDLGNSSIIKHGHCWSKNPNPTIADYNSDLGIIEGTGDFYSYLTNLMPGITQYVRSYLYDGNNYLYGEVLSFQISGDDIQFNTSDATKINNSTIRIKSSTNGIGSVNFKNHGHCWSKKISPTWNDSKTALGPYKTDTTFESQIVSLNEGRYYIRAYLEAEGGITYSNEVIYDSEISVTTDLISTGSGNTAKVYGTITSLGVNPILKYGHCWSTFTSNPGINYSSEYNSLGATTELKEFSSDLINLISGRVYYVRSYATDGVKVYYGAIKNFKAN